MDFKIIGYVTLYAKAVFDDNTQTIVKSSMEFEKPLTHTRLRLVAKGLAESAAKMYGKEGVASYSLVTEEEYLEFQKTSQRGVKEVALSPSYAPLGKSVTIEYSGDDYTVEEER